MAKSKSNSIYTSKEKEKLISEATKSVEKEFGVKRSRYARWICKNGYVFDIFFTEDVKENKIFCELSVKPIYVDDLLWYVIYKKELRPFSLRLTGGLAVTSVTLKDFEGWEINGDEGYQPSEIIKLYRYIYASIYKEIDSFLKKNADVDKFYYFNSNWSNILLTILILSHQQKYTQALYMTEKEIAMGKSGGCTFIMPDGSEKTTFEFIREYCMEQLERNFDKA